MTSIIYCGECTMLTEYCRYHHRSKIRQMFGINRNKRYHKLRRHNIYGMIPEEKLNAQQEKKMKKIGLKYRAMKQRYETKEEKEEEKDAQNNEDNKDNNRDSEFVLINNQ
eukprot:444629_1